MGVPMNQWSSHASLLRYGHLWAILTSTHYLRYSYQLCLSHTFAAYTSHVATCLCQILPLDKTKSYAHYMPDIAPIDKTK